MDETEMYFASISDLQDQSRERKAASKQDKYIKRPVNAFILWSNIQRRSLALELEKNSGADILKRLGAMWRLLTEDEKKPFFKESERLRYS